MEGKPVVMDARDPNRLLTVHGSLLETVANNGVRLTMDGRLFVLTFLMHEGLLARGDFSNILVKNAANPKELYVQTGVMLRKLAEKWIQLHDADLLQRPKVTVQGTDLDFQAVGVLMWVLAKSQASFETSIGR